MDTQGNIQILEGEIKKLEMEIQPIVNRIDGYKAAINLLRASLENEETDSISENLNVANDYPINGDNYAKLGYIMNFYGRFIHSNDVKKLVLKNEKSETEAKMFLQTLSQKLYKCVARGLFVDIQYNKSKHHTFYGKKEWITQAGNTYSIIRGHEPSSEYLKSIDVNTLKIKGL